MSVELVCISCAHRADRRARLLRRMDSLGLKAALGFHLVQKDTEDPRRGCFASHVAVARAALADPRRAFTLVLEDDAVPAPDFDLGAALEHCAQARAELLLEHTLMLTWQGTDPALPAHVLVSHSDVVPAPGPDAWTLPPFAGEVRDSFVWGRGTLDTKTSLVQILSALERLARRPGFQPRRTLVVCFGHDEETGGAGARAAAPNPLHGYVAAVDVRRARKQTRHYSRGSGSPPSRPVARARTCPLPSSSLRPWRT